MSTSATRLPSWARCSRSALSRARLRFAAVIERSSSSGTPARRDQGPSSARTPPRGACASRRRGSSCSAPPPRTPTPPSPPARGRRCSPGAARGRASSPPRPRPHRIDRHPLGQPRQRVVVEPHRVPRRAGGRPQRSAIQRTGRVVIDPEDLALNGAMSARRFSASSTTRPYARGSSRSRIGLPSPCSSPATKASSGLTRSLRFPAARSSAADATPTEYIQKPTRWNTHPGPSPPTLHSSRASRSAASPLTRSYTLTLSTAARTASKPSITRARLTVVIRSPAPATRGGRGR